MTLRSLLPLLLLLLLTPALSRAESPLPSASTDPELTAVQSAFDVGRFDQALQRARARIDRGDLSGTDLASLHRLAGLSALNLRQSDEAERHFSALLRISPDYVLDPFEIPPATVAFFEDVRKKLSPQLDLIREQQRLDAERLRREAQERAQKQKEDEERRRRLEELSRRVTVRTVERRSFLVNLVPFGAGQFQQGRTAMGVTLAATQGAAALTSVIAYFAYNGVLKDEHVTVDTVEGPVTLTRPVIPQDRKQEAATWSMLKYGAAGAFYLLYGYGIVDAIYHHQDEVVTTTQVQLPPEQPVRPVKLRDTAAPSTTGYLYPTTGGLGAGVSVRF